MKIFYSIVCCFSVLLATAQVEHIGRYETEYDWNTEDFIPVPNAGKGVLIIRAERSLDGNDFTTRFTHLNNEFEETWSKSLEVSKSLFIKGYDFNGDQTYVLFQDRTESRILKIVRVDPYNDSITEFEPRRLTEMEVTNFDVIQNSAVIAGYISNRPAAFVYNMDNEKLVTLNNVYQNKSELLEVKINADSLTFNIAVAVQDEKKDRTVQINTYDFEGNPIRDYELITPNNYQLMTASTSSIFAVEQLTVGLYNLNLGTSPSGVYVNHVNRKGQQTMNFLPFGEFNTFFAHEGEKRAAKLKRKSLSAHKKGKAYRYRTAVLFRSMLEEEDKIVLQGEFFKVWGGNSQNTGFSSGYDYAGRDRFNERDPMRGIQRESSNEYQFTHAWALAIDKSGNVLWDYNAPIGESIEGLLRPYGDFTYNEGNLFYAHYYDQELLVDHMNKKVVKDTTFSTSLTLLNEDELLFEDEVFRGLVKWHENKYLVYGIQHVRPKDKSVDRRRVFYINGISIGPNLTSGQ